MGGGGALNILRTERDTRKHIESIDAACIDNRRIEIQGHK